MKNNILNALSKNLGFKILAVIFAFTLWLTVYNIEDPTKSKTLTINVNVTNKEYVESLGKYFEIKDGTSKVSFSVTAARSVLDKLDESDFTAVANMEQIVITEDGTEGTVPIEITCTANVNSNSVRLSSTSKNLKLNLEDLMTKQFVVTASAVGEVAEGYALGSVEVTAPNVLKVSGPSSVVENIASVVATIDVSGMSDTWTSYKATPILFDSKGKEIDTTRLTFSDETVNVSAEILNIKDVAITAKTIGTPANGYEVTSISCNPATIQLKGDKALLNSINEIVIPEGVISVADAVNTVTATIDVSEYIPEGVSLAEPENATVEVTVGIGKNKEKSFTLKTKNITVVGLRTGGEIEFDVESVAVTVSGLEADINTLSNNSIKASIDVTNLKAGTHQVALVLDLDTTKYSYKPVKVKVKITVEDSVETGTGSAENTENSENVESTQKPGTTEKDSENKDGSNSTDNSEASE